MIKYSNTHVLHVYQTYQMHYGLGSLRVPPATEVDKYVILLGIQYILTYC